MAAPTFSPYSAFATAVAGAGHVTATPSTPFSNIYKTLIPVHPELDYSSAVRMLKDSSHIEGEDGSPGTILLIPSTVPGKSGSQVFDAIVVNALGEKRLETVTLSEGKWKNGTKTLYDTYEALARHLVEMPAVIGDCPGIQFFTAEQQNRAEKALASSKEGTYICFAHEPINDLKGPDGSSVPPPKKRNILMWNGPEGIRTAYFHCARPETGVTMWENGGPGQGPVVGSEEDEVGTSGCTGGSVSPTRPTRSVLTDSTLFGLIYKKVSESGCTPIPLSLDVV